MGPKPPFLFLPVLWSVAANRGPPAGSKSSMSRHGQCFCWCVRCHLLVGTIISPAHFIFAPLASQIANSSIVQTSRVPTKLSYFGLDSSNSSHLPMLLQLLFPASSPLLALTKSKRGRNFCLLAIFAFLLLLECPQLGGATQNMDIEKSAELNQTSAQQGNVFVPPAAPILEDGGQHVRAGRVKRQHPHVHDNSGFSVKNLVELVFCFFLPPAAVALHGGPSFKLHIVLNVVLCVLGWIPGILHAIWYCFMSGF